MVISSPAKARWQDSTWYFFTILFFIVLVFIVGFCFVLQQKQFLLREKSKEIATIANLKTAQLIQWRKDRLAQGSVISNNAMIARSLTNYYSGNDNTTIIQDFRHWLDTIIKAGEYSQGVLFTPNGKIIASDADLHAPLAWHYFNMVAEAVKERRLILSDFHSDIKGDPYEINLAIPIMQPDGTNSRCIAVLVLDIDPHKRLYPLIQSWPTTSATAETLLVMREGNSVLFLNNLRHLKHSATPYRLPLTNTNIPAVRAVLGLEGSAAGTDYRDMEVLSATRIIPGTSWGIVAKIDIREVLSPLSKIIFMVISAGIVVIITMTLGLFLWGLRRKAETLRKLYDIERKYNIELEEAEVILIKSRNYHLKLLEIIPSLIWRSGTDAKCDYFNQTWLDFTGRNLTEELGYGWTAGVHPDDLDKCIATYKEAFQVQRPFVMEYRLRFNDSSYHWINDHGHPYYDPDGVFAGYIGSCFDINAQKIAEAELQSVHANLEQKLLARTADLSEINSLLRQEIEERQRLEQQLLRAKRLEAIGQIAGGVAHEVRNPLNAILTITEALFMEKEIASNPEFEPFNLHIKTQVKRLVHLMNDLLDLGRTIPATELRPVPLYKVCCETISLWKNTGTSKNREIVLSSDSDETSIFVRADGHKLQQVLFNLLENAGHHTRDNSTIMIRLTSNNNGMAVFQVIDHGTGIPEDNLTHVFDPFFTKRMGGTGLGLALVKHFIESMDGSVQIWNNSASPGCTVEVRIHPCTQESP
jgi:PAS domain S-box-containing protein